MNREEHLKGQISHEEKHHIITKKMKIKAGTESYQRLMCDWNTRIQHSRSMQELLLPKGEKRVWKFEDTIGKTPEIPLDAKRFKEHIRATLNALTTREREVVSLYLGFPGPENREGREHRFREIGSIIGTSRARAGFIYNQTLEKIRGMISPAFLEVME